MPLRHGTEIDLVIRGADPHDARMGDGFQADMVTQQAVVPGADTPAPAIETTDTMDIHKPKPIHNMRELLGEIGIIVIGVLMALAAEQTVEALHHRSQAIELSEALDVELSHNLAVLKDTVELTPCIDRRLGDIAKWSMSVSAGRPLQLAGEFGRMPGQISLTAIWRSTGTSLELLPLDKRIDYARFYDNFGNSDRIRDEMRDKWSDLANFEGAATLAAREVLQIAHDIRDIRRATEVLAANYTILRDRMSAKIHVVAKKNGESAASSAYLKQRRAEFCKPLLAG
ncbi:hypothetical protein U1839_01795 [Sphingomonas sp. RT2P30]|uniref:hypothetical protein n=1 Tax=Parasphingomonas halimpatiens TaxID=3096162 RepID=UPI002FC9539F